jgi:hypothetical protein
MGQLVVLKLFHSQNHIEWNIIIRHTHLLNLNEFIKKHETLQDNTFKGLPKNVIPIAIWLFIQGSNTFETINKLLLSTTICFSSLFN